MATISHVPMPGILVQDVDKRLSKSIAAGLYGRVMPVVELSVVFVGNLALLAVGGEKMNPCPSPTTKR